MFSSVDSFNVMIFNVDLMVSFDIYQPKPVIWRREVDCSASSFDQLVLDNMLAVYAVVPA